MTLILENVDSKLLQVIESLKGLKSDLKITKELESKSDFESVREQLQSKLQDPEIRSVFERLKDK
ncbi:MULTISPECIES: hypothetical protein [Campylobacterales]|uniref:Uncharacterized protein n=1 Tax=Helicobacter canis NCTC 12740 TaxID=1357399 RepID=V8CJS5_9HELI|nr:MULTISPECIES: hypothetical protein [Campylobacterales]EEO26212.1 hypothetical protein HWAG_01004 [Helicobacter winghamensis ATCC BAA-430]ETD27653.1 hypothetical protein HMPREF2087_00572 [Helicobacter canis NCTC 12740]MCR2054395.1 hypothetical protein [Campylobacter helveticus]MDL0080856.1 hypothetical protein [Helicobacter sp. CPD2-1]PKT77408.1 hypothetical protein BCM34_00405 [Helicobacter winghamensis]